ncbi:Arrestin domain-containing protein 15 [Hondaea fermentalgiana]|uniref:Arrestin domain-containing protein 15 n=1 Tax=Hondaea fermentalgiana TaxID=2315210 RepID=A0A2R5G448_9STRA|nr:Arrestin domain-containing protein 15 [Hondaea fermentalgiana]|eukprot:GBG25325.1 Arrestin domain-containing protein 15 [Hondaea fermentalgiana]
MGGAQSAPERRLGTLDVAVEREYYYPGERVQAYVQIEVRRAVRCAGVYVDLRCLTETNIKNVDGVEAKETIDALRPSTILITPECTFEPGKYQFPFAFKLPLATPPTVEVKSVAGIFARTSFAMAVRFRAAKGTRDQSRRYRIRVLNRPQQPMRPLRVENTRVLHKFCCLRDGVVHCKLTVNEPAFTTGDEIRANFEISNSSMYTVSKLSMRTIVTYEVSANGKSIEITGEGSPEHVSSVTVGPSSTSRGSISIPFEFVYPSVDAHTLKIFHRVVFRAQVWRKGQVEIVVPILAYGDHADTTIPSKPSKPKSRRFLPGSPMGSSRRQANVELEGARGSSRIGPGDFSVVATAVPDPSGDTGEELAFAEPIAFVPDAHVIESTSKEFALARTPSATFE